MKSSYLHGRTKVEHCFVATPVGTLQISAGPDGLVACSFVSESADAPNATTNPLLLRAREQLDEYFAGTRQRFDLTVDTTGLSAFAQHILTELRQIPYGTVITYGELAARAGFPRAARAVGRVMAGNRLPILIPCHRVIGKSGAMTGYSGGAGVPTKQWLLRHEQRD